MTNTSRPIQRQAIRRSLEALAKKQKDILTLIGAFDTHLKDAWAFTDLGQKELPDLQAHARDKRLPFESYYIVRVAKR